MRGWPAVSTSVRGACVFAAIMHAMVCARALVRARGVGTIRWTLMKESRL